ncbi:GNAT family N-acetyltransferase [soil metagenome]
MLSVRRIRSDEGPVLRATRLAALADAPGESTTTLARAEAHDDDHWSTSAAANASGPMQATFFAEAGDGGGGDPIGLVGAYANRSGVVNLVGLWSAPGHRDIGVASALIAAVAEWALSSGDRRLRFWVVERNEFARRFYEGEGFVATGTVMPYEPDPRINQVEMVLDL